MDSKYLKKQGALQKKTSYQPFVESIMQGRLETKASDTPHTQKGLTTSTLHFYESASQALPQKNYSFDNRIIIFLLQFNPDDVPKFLCISPAWHYSVISAFD